MPPTIEINHVTKRFGHTTAVDDVSLTIPAGCVFALLGENGAGKTTLVRMLLGLLPPDAGEITVLGIPLLGISAAKQGEAIRQRVGYVPERPTLYDWMTASEIGWFTAGFYPDGFEQQYRNLLDRYRVPASRKIGQMSKGMRSKVALSLALAPQPELLVLDEPTSGLDTLVRREFLESMVDLAAEGRTVVLSSHLIGEVERIADHVAILKSGQTLTIDPLDELKRQAFDVTLTMPSAAAEPPPLPGRVLQRRHRGKQWQVLLRDVADASELTSLSEYPDVIAVETHTPSLEEIFIAYMQAEPEHTVRRASQPVEL
jgi:ABC-2 type transport system ATP-binding protein